jgi:membrane fusion protein (multidrug efflux system)
MGFGAGCGKPRNPVSAAASAAAVVVETAERRDVPILVDLVARTDAVATVEIRANVEGRLTEAAFHEGRMVHKGQVLFRIDPRRYQAEVQSAGAAVEKAMADLEMSREQQRLVNAQSALRQAAANLLKTSQELERLKPLAARHAVPQRDLDAAIAEQASAAAAVEDARATLRTTTVSDRLGVQQAQAGLTAARAALEKAELDREETVICSPIQGLIGRVEVAAGNYVGRGEPSRLATISQLDPIQVVFSIPEALYLQTRTKVQRSALERIELILSDNTSYSSRGRVTSVGRAVDPKTGTLQVVAEFPNPHGILLPGMFGRVRLAVETRHDAVLISERALFDVQGSKAVYLVNPENKALLRSVAAEGSYKGKSIVTRGLSGGEAVIVEGILKVRPGQTVTAQPPEAGQRQ